MFGMGMGELIVIAIVALLFLGPDKLPGAAKAIGKGIRDFRRHTRDLQSTIEQDTELGDAVRDLKSALRGEDPRPIIRQPVQPPVPAPPTLPAVGAPGEPAALAGGEPAPAPGEPAPAPEAGPDRPAGAAHADPEAGDRAHG
jgi:sec-independent protein translocase protein TatB